ncbi:MAG TPA: four helix bundle protein [Tepidisphaeraceae bacterium]|nr:four helix bundle protein [Tepidisphaeraceae bacterium]
MTYGDNQRGPLWHGTKRFALDVIRLYVELPKTGEAQVIGRQMIRSGTSPGSQYREACRARSVAEFVSKMSGGLQELEETGYWFELLVEGDIVPVARLAKLQPEANELTAMFVSSIKTARKGQR